MALEPQHHRCYWGRHYLSEISLTEGELHGAGVGIRTFLFALAGFEKVWHAAELDAENAVFLILPAVHDQESTTPSQPVLPEELKEKLGITERALGAELQERLGIELGTEPVMVGKPEFAKHVVELHDDCFFRYTTHDPAGVELVLGGILAQHGVYLGRTGLQTLAPELLRLLQERGTVRLRSVPSAARVDVLAQREPGLREWLRPPARIAALEYSGTTWSLRTPTASLRL